MKEKHLRSTVYWVYLQHTTHTGPRTGATAMDQTTAKNAPRYVRAYSPRSGASDPREHAVLPGQPEFDAQAVCGARELWMLTEAPGDTLIPFDPWNSYACQRCAKKVAT